MFPNRNPPPENLKIPQHPLNFPYHQLVESLGIAPQLKTNPSLLYDAYLQHLNQNEKPSLFGQQQPVQYMEVPIPQPSPFPFKISQSIQKPKQQQKIFGEDDEIDLSIQPNQQQQIYDLDKNLTFEIRSIYNQSCLQKQKYLQGMISLKLKEEQQELNQQSRVGVDLICLIDKSGSMSGNKITMVQQTLNVLLSFLTHKDRLQLITFNDKGEKLTPLKKINDENKQYLKNVISSLNADGGTNISSATEIAFQQMQNRKQKNNVTSIFILSDGQDKKAQHKMKQQMKKLDEVFTINTFGFGRDHDSKLMTALCNLGKGSFYFVQNISLLDEYFADALGSLISVVGTEITIKANCISMPPFQGVKLSQTFGSAWIPIEDKIQYKINIPQVSSGQRKDFVFEMKLPIFEGEINEENRITQLMDAQIKIRDATSGKIIKKKAALIFTVLNQEQEFLETQQDVDVAAQYYRVKASEVIEEARKKCEKKQNQQAQKIIENMIVTIQKNKDVAALCGGILQDLQQAKLGSAKDLYSLFGEQLMHQMVSNNYNQSGMNAQFSANGSQMQQVCQQPYQNLQSFNLMQQVQYRKP